MHTRQPSNRVFHWILLAFHPSVILFILVFYLFLLFFFLFLHKWSNLLLIYYFVFSSSDYSHTYIKQKKKGNKHLVLHIYETRKQNIKSHFFFFFLSNAFLFDTKLSIDWSLICSMSRTNNKHYLFFRMFNIDSNGSCTKQFELFD